MQVTSMCLSFAASAGVAGTKSCKRIWAASVAFSVALAIQPATGQEACMMTPKELPRADRWPAMYAAMVQQWIQGGYQTVELTQHQNIDRRCAVTRRGRIDGDATFARHINNCFWANGVGSWWPGSVEETQCEHKKENGHFSKTTGTPWSAGFISYIFRAGGVPEADFKGALGHDKYLQYIRTRMQTPGMPDFTIYPSAERAPKVGDLICARRGCASEFSFNNLNGPAHCDFVVEVDQSSMVVKAIGGNVQDGVSMTITPIDSKGRLVSIRDVRPWNIVVENRLAEGSSVPALPSPPGSAHSPPLACVKDRALDTAICGIPFVASVGALTDAKLEVCEPK